MNRLLISLVSLSFLGCGPGAELSGDELGQASAELTLAPGSAEKILALVNYPGTDLATLDAKVGLDRRAATGLIAHRDGADGLALSLDDDLFDTLAELDAVPYVADSALSKLLAYAEAHPAPSGEIAEGVVFKGWESEIVVWGLNNAGAGVLDGMLDARAAQNLMANRPYASVRAAGLIGYVGPAALDRLRQEAPTWWAARSAAPGQTTLAGTFDGIVFDQATAAQALQLANSATAAQLTAKGVYAAGANMIVAARPLATLAAVAALRGVGPSSLQALKTWAQAANAPVPTLAEVRSAIEAASNGLLMPSETDAIFVYLQGGQLNGAPITVQVVRSQFTAQHDALIATVMYTDPSQRSLAAKTQVEERSAAAFLDNVINNVDPNDPVSVANGQKFATLKAVLQAQLTDLKVYRFGRISISTLIVGRAPSGELVGLLTGQVET